MKTDERPPSVENCEAKDDKSKQLFHIQIMDTPEGKMVALIDSGAEANFIKDSTVKEKGLTIIQSDKHLDIRVANG